MAQAAEKVQVPNFNGNSNKIRISNDVLEKARQIATQSNTRNPRLVIEAVFRAYADQWWTGTDSSRNKTIAQDVLDKAQTIGKRVGLEDPLSVIEAVFRTYADQWGVLPNEENSQRTTEKLGE